MHASSVRLGAVLWALLLFVAALWLLHALSVRGMPGEIRVEISLPAVSGEDDAGPGNDADASAGEPGQAGTAQEVGEAPADPPS